MKFQWVLLYLFLPVCSTAQIDYFITIDAEGGQPFSVLINNQVYSSTSDGHLIIPKLKDTSYWLNVNFPKNEFPDHFFKVLIAKRDRGYDLKKVNDKSWILYDWQRRDSLVSMNKHETFNPKNETLYRNDPLASLLAGTLKDSSILVASNPAKPPSEKRDSTKSSTVVKPGIIPGTKGNGQKVELLVDKVVSGGRQFVYALMNGDLMEEAVVLLIHSESNQMIPFLDSVNNIDTSIKKEDQLISGSHPRDSLVNSDSLLFRPIQLDSLASIINIPGNKDSIDISHTKEAIPDSLDLKIDKNKSVLMLNSDCQAFATDSDVDKLRVKMLDQKTMENKLAAARKAFKAKCYSSGQIRALSELFPDESEKFELLQLSFPFVSDTPNFKLLKDLFQQPEFLVKFKQLVRL